MITEKLARENETVVKSFDEGMKLADTDFLVEETIVDLADLSLNEFGSISCGGDEYQITDWAFESLCSLLKIPKEFARTIPTELLLQNFERLKVEKNKKVNMFISRNTVINLIEAPYFPTKNKDLLIRLNNVAGELSLGVNEIRTSDRGMVLSFLKEGLSLEPMPGDITRFGINIQNSETGYRGAKANFYLLRLVCTNGAVASNNWGSVKLDYDARISRERSLSNFIEGIKKLGVDFKKFNDFYNGLINRELKAYEFINIWRRLSRVVGNEEADRISMVSQDVRNHLNKEVREGNRLLPTGVALYNLYNAVTEAARRHQFIQRQNLEVLGGALIDL